MRFYLCFAIIICLLGWVGACLGAADEAASAAPRLTTPETTWDFGEVTAGEKPEHTFTIENTGDAPLTIRRVLHSCGGCFKTILAEKDLAPGEKTTLKLVVDTARRKGPLQKYIYIESNDRQAGRRRIVITGTIKPPDGAEDHKDEVEERRRICRRHAPPPKLIPFLDPLDPMRNLQGIEDLAGVVLAEEPTALVITPVASSCSSPSVPPCARCNLSAGL